jgi:23S rRNA pseudouridine1911/1915/1917 synthase
VKLNRQALHAHTLEFDHPETNERLAFSMEMPADMQRLVDALQEACGVDRKVVRGQRD